MQFAERLALVAGEASGDLLASVVLPALRTRLPQASLCGIGGDRMIAEGLDAWWHVRELSVRGYAEVLRHLPRLLKLRRQLTARVLAWPASTYIGIDAPDFNLGVELKLRAARIRTVQFVAPAVWAWRPRRIDLVRRAVDHLLAVFPFELPLFERAGVRCTYVGHPLALTIALQPDAAAARTRLNVPINAPTVAALPGSRAAEIDALGPPFCAAIALLLRGDKTLHVVMPAADARLHERLQRMIERTRMDASRITLTLGRSNDCLEAADTALVASGTATLEAMLFQRPMVIAYKVPLFTEYLTRRKALIPWIGLPNILAGDFIVPEFLQAEVDGKALAAAVLRYLEDAALVARLRERFVEMREALTRDTPGLVADAIATTP